MQNPPLENVQRWMQSVITHPAGLKSGLESSAAREHLDVAASDLDVVIDASQSQTALERLDIYAKAYHARLIECLEAEFPIFCQAVGQEAFAAFAFEYLRLRPSTSYTLAQLGAGFADFLEQTKPPPEQSNAAADWPAFLVDLARLERTFSEVFDGPGIENQPTLSSADLLAIDPARWPQARLSPVPCLRILSLRFPLNGYYTAMKHSSAAPVPPSCDSWLAVTRRDFIVRRYELTHQQFILLSALAAGQTIGDAIADAAQIETTSLETLADNLRAWFETWAAAPMFHRLVLN